MRTQIAHERRRLPREPDETVSPPSWSVQAPDEKDLFTHEPMASRSEARSSAMAPHGHLILGPVPGSYRYYGAASSVYLSVCVSLRVFQLADKLQKKTISSSDQAEVTKDSPLGESLLRFLGPPLGHLPVHTLEEVLAEYLPPFHEAQRLAGFFFEVRVQTTLR